MLKVKVFQLQYNFTTLSKELYCHGGGIRMTDEEELVSKRIWQGPIIQTYLAHPNRWRNSPYSKLFCLFRAPKNVSAIFSSSTLNTRVL